MEKSISNKSLILLIVFALIIMLVSWNMGWVVFFCFLVIGYCALMMWLNKACQRDIVFSTTLPADVVEQVARKQFNGLAWKVTEGSGDLNWKQRLSGLTISMDIDEDPDSDTKLLIKIYMSRWSTRYGVVSGSEHVVRQQRRIVKKLQAIQDETLNART